GLEPCSPTSTTRVPGTVAHPWRALRPHRLEAVLPRLSSRRCNRSSVSVVATKPMLSQASERRTPPGWSGSGAPLRLGCAGCVRHGLEEKCPCDPSAAPAGRVGPRAITHFSIFGRARRDDPEKRHLWRHGQL